ncbi:hypothetical protein COCOBI_09-5890 [Coccomyxa sp. Obi]|nr:hypothetical protein COCOBI_09-5890 [Coccomyxa sp. Obi]
MCGNLLLLYASVVLLCSGLAASASNYTVLQPISVDKITFKPNSALAVPANLDRDFVAAIEPEELTWAFLRNSNMSVDPKWRRRFTNSWEDPLEMNLAGEFTGHYLKATGQFCQNTGDEALLGRAVQVVEYLSMAQDRLGGGYLYAFPEYHFERLSHQAETHIMSAMNDGWPWDMDKVIGGLVDFYRYQSVQLALVVAAKIVDNWLIPFVQSNLDNFGPLQLQRMLAIEFGAMQETLSHLFQITGNSSHAWVASQFTKDDFFLPLAQRVDVLPDNHANTYLAQVTGYVACYEATGNATCKAAAINFIDILLANHSWSTGGSNSDEHWGEPLQMGHFLLDDKVSIINGNDTRLTYSRLTQETCTAHNTVKIVQAVFTWTLDMKYLDAMERLVYNGILGTQRMPVERQHHHDISFIEEWRLRFINASYDRTAEANTCTPAERLGENLNGIDVIKPGPSVRTYLTPMGHWD